MTDVDVTRDSNPADAQQRAERLRRFVGLMAAHDHETVDFWRAASPAAHAAAMIELSEYAERMSAQTGIGKDPTEMFPGFARWRAVPRRGAA